MIQTTLDELKSAAAKVQVDWGGKSKGDWKPECYWWKQLQRDDFQWTVGLRI